MKKQELVLSFIESMGMTFNEGSVVAYLVDSVHDDRPIEQLEKAREVATSTKFMAENEKANHKDGDGWTWSDAKSK